jgi:Protein of unknown function (DUF2809)
MLLIPLGLGTKFYHGPAQGWVHASAGDILYGAFCLFALKAISPGLPAGKAMLAALLFCAAVEFTQLLHSPALDSFRHTLPGHLLLGSGFEWADIGYYALGAAPAAALAHVLEVKDG